MVFFSAIIGIVGKVISPFTNGCASVLQSTVNTVDRLGDGCHLFLESVADSTNKLCNGLLSSLATLTRTLNISLILLTNAVLGLAAMVALAPLLYLSEFSSILRFIVWMMYASLCLSMVVTYIQQQHFPTGKTTSLSHFLIREKVWFERLHMDYFSIIIRNSF